MQKGKRALEAYQQILSKQHQNSDDLFQSLYDTYLALGELFEGQSKFDKAIESFTKSIGILSRTDESDKSTITEMQKRIAKLLYKQVKVQEALEAYQDILSAQLQSNKEDNDISFNKSLANTYFEISNIQSELNESAEAIQNNEYALDIALKCFEEGDLDTAQYYISLGEKLSLEGDAESAIEKINKGLFIQLVALGMSHPTVGKTYMDLGMVHQARSLTFEALECYMKSLEVFESCQEGAHDEDIATLYEFIGDVYCEEDRFGEAVDFYKESIEIRRQKDDVEEKKITGLLYRKLGDCNVEVLRFSDAKGGLFTSREDLQGSV